MTKMSDFTLKRTGAGWNKWEVHHKGQLVATLDKAQARAAMLGRYDPAALARGELVAKEKQGVKA